MVGLIAENAKEGTYSDAFDRRYRKIAEEINELKEKQSQYRKNRRLAENYEKRVTDVENFLQNQSYNIPEFDNDLVRRLVSSIKVVSAEKLIIQFQSGIVMEQGIRKD